MVATGVCELYEADRKGVMLPWSVVTGPLALLAAAALGVALGLIFRGLWTVPLVVLAVFLGHRVTYWSALPELLTLKQATGSAANGGYRQLGAHLMASAAVNAMAALALLAIGAALSYPRGLRPRLLAIVVGVCVVVIGIVLGWGWADSYEPIPS